MTSPFRASFRSIRGKLTLAAVAPLVLILLLVAMAASYLINASIVNQTQKQIQNDLSAARVVLDQERQRIRELVRFTARSSTLRSALASGKQQLLADELEQIRSRERLDIFNLTDSAGRTFLSQTEPNNRPNFLKAALTTDQYNGTTLLSAAEMEQERPELDEQAKISASEQPQIVLETRGMFLLATSLVKDAQGKTLGCLYAGILLNNNLPLIDRISQLVYGQDTFEGVAVGSATIFLDKLRIATTVRLKDGRRALGTQVSQEVAETVLQRGEAWLARALVVNEWYLTAYEPIFDASDHAIGALYVGMLEKPLIAVKKRAFFTLFGLLVLGCLLGGLLAGWFARRFSEPVLALASSAEKIAGGERDVPLPVGGQDEIGHLAEAFADMTNALKKSDAELQNLNSALEQKVADRTSQLEEKSLQLIKTQEQLLRHEKLAAIGSLATGVAHEINNPAAIIRGNVEILKMSLPEDATEREEVDEIMKQVERVSLITRNLLNFAGKQELASDQVDIGLLLDEILGQISHQQPLEQVNVIRRYDKLPTVPGDRERLRQVFINIILNALQATDGTGTLEIAAEIDASNLVVSIADTGPGIPPEIREKIFNPFFTTKQQGTGLGLSVSYGIIQAHEGAITLANNDKEGSCLMISLPL